MPDQSKAKKPVWEVQVRPIGAPHEPWQTRKVRASSVLQAEAIMRRLGYEMASQSAFKSDTQPDPARPAELSPLVCARCGYELSGLTIQRASVICTECAYPQPIMAWTPERSRLIDRNHPLMGIFVVIGILATILFGLLILIPILFAIF